MHTDDRRDNQLTPTDAATLVAVLLAARRCCDPLLERVARRELEVRHRLQVRFLPADRAATAM